MLDGNEISRAVIAFFSHILKRDITGIVLYLLIPIHVPANKPDKRLKILFST